MTDSDEKMKFGMYGSGLALCPPSVSTEAGGRHAAEGRRGWACRDHCLATVGAKVGVDEVILVGISELGDVILTMQRINVQARDVTSRIAESLAPDEAPTADQLGQYLARLLPASDFIRFGTIKIVAAQAGAAVTVGGQARGKTPIEPLRLRAPAAYDIKVEKPGFVAFRANVAVPADGEIEVHADLSRVGGATHWYQKWWVLAAALSKLTRPISAA